LHAVVGIEPIVLALMMGGDFNDHLRRLSADRLRAMLLEQFLPEDASRFPGARGRKGGRSGCRAARSLSKRRYLQDPV
jgi:hypothetical protein